MDGGRTVSAPHAGHPLGGNRPLQFVAAPACCVFRVRTLTEVTIR